MTGYLKYLRATLMGTGLICIFGVWPLTIVWPSGWSWHADGGSEYLEMILGIYATLGVFLVRASRDPLAHTSLIWFTVWSSVVHGAIMAVQSLLKPQHIGHLWGDVLALIAIGVALGVLTSRAAASSTGGDTGG